MIVDLRGGNGESAFASVRQFLRPRVVRERCELCDAELADEHAHLLELDSARLQCACDPCAILFSNHSNAKYRRVPRRVQFLDNFKLTDAQWLALDIPINLAFLSHSTRAGRVVALYPSPAGTTESLPAPEAWESLLEDNPVLRQMEPDVEALLVNRLGTPEAYCLTGIDECYKLVGTIRKHWKGMSGGAAVWGEVAGFFAGLRERSSCTVARAHA
jgi:hypothetical protein